MCGKELTILSFIATFWLYFVICLVGLVFVILMLPETKGKTLEEVQELFMSREYKERQDRQKNYTSTDTKF